MTMYPGMQKAMEKFRSEKVNMEGTAVQTLTTMESVQSKEQMAEAQSEDEKESSSIGGLFGGFAKKLAKKDKKETEAASGRTKVMTMSSEILSLRTSVPPIEIPAGFKEKR